MDDKAEKCILVGYSENSKADRLHNPVSQGNVISRKVTFDEECSRSWKIEPEKQMDDEDTRNDRNDEDEETKPYNEDTTAQENEEPWQSRRSARFHKQSTRCSSSEYVMITNENPKEMINFALFSGANPIIFEEAYEDLKWRTDMDQQIESTDRNNTLELTKLPKDKKQFGAKWVYKTKFNSKKVEALPPFLVSNFLNRAAISFSCPSTGISIKLLKAAIVEGRI